MEKMRTGKCCFADFEVRIDVGPRKNEPKEALKIYWGHI